ncbi:MAG: metal-dependent hydrolase [bacterium]
MDPVSQGAIGAALAQSASKPEYLRAFAVFGALAGLAPDLDVLIQSSTDPLLFLEYHRHFTHALIFIPVGALIVAGIVFRLWRHPLTFKQAYIASLLGYATHALLDACTTYGTQLLWPFSDMRVAWNNVSVVDPLFTLPLLVCVIISLRRRRPQIAAVGMVWALFYLCLGVWQHDRARNVAIEMASAKGHVPLRLEVKPGFANLILWKSVYEFEGTYYVDAVRVTAKRQWCAGSSIDKLDVAFHYPELDPNSQQARDIERFRWFSNDYLAPFQPHGFIIDIRYAAVPNDINPLWGISVDELADAAQHAQFVPNRRVGPEQTQALLQLLRGTGCRDVTLKQH